MRLGRCPCLTLRSTGRATAYAAAFPRWRSAPVNSNVSRHQLIHTHEILALDLLTLREHTERAGDTLDPEKLLESIENSFSVSEFAAVRRHGALVAYARLQPQQLHGHWFIAGFNTHPNHRNSPVFKSLLAQIIQITSRREISVLQSHVYKTNIASLAFHSRLGFKITRESEKAVEFTAKVSNILSNKLLVAQ